MPARVKAVGLPLYISVVDRVYVQGMAWYWMV